MPLLQYFGWVGSFLVAVLFAANWCCSPAIAPMFPSIRRSTSGSIRTINGLNAWYSTRRGRRWHKVATHRRTSADARRPLWRNTNRSTHSRRWRLCPSGHVFDRPAPPVWLQRGRSHQSRTARQFKIAYARQMWHARASLSPIGFTSRKEEVDAFAHERWQLAAEFFRSLAHQSPHHHWQQNEIHENLRGGETSFGTEGPL